MTHQDFFNLSDIHRVDLDLSLLILDSLMVDFDFESVNFNADKIIQSNSEQNNLQRVYEYYMESIREFKKDHFKSEKGNYLYLRELTYNRFYKLVFKNQNLKLCDKLYRNHTSWSLKVYYEPYYRHYISPHIKPERIQYGLSKGYIMTIHRNQWSNFYTIRIIPSKSRYNKNKWQWGVAYNWNKNITSGDESNYYKIDNEYYHHGYFLFPCQNLEKTIKIAKYFIHHFKTEKLCNRWKKN